MWEKSQEASKRGPRESSSLLNAKGTVSEDALGENTSKGEEMNPDHSLRVHNMEW